MAPTGSYRATESNLSIKLIFLMMGHIIDKVSTDLRVSLNQANTAKGFLSVHQNPLYVKIIQKQSSTLQGFGLGEPLKIFRLKIGLWHSRIWECLIHCHMLYPNATKTWLNHLVRLKDVLTHALRCLSVVF